MCSTLPYYPQRTTGLSAWKSGRKSKRAKIKIYIPVRNNRIARGERDKEQAAKRALNRK